MNDIVTILRDISNERNIDADLAEACRDGAREIERLRLTDAEREAVSVAFGMMNERAAKLQDRPDTREAARPFIKWARALQGLFERLGGER